MLHLSPDEIEALVDRLDIPAEQRAHLADCALCRQRVASMERIERALAGIKRDEPAPDLPQRIITQMPRHPPAPRWLVPVTVGGALVSFILAYQTAFDLRANGVFDLLAVYSSQPQIVVTYPAVALGALTTAVPWVTLGASLVALALVLILVYQMAGASLWVSRLK
jgi:hypothetical protein